MVHLLAASTYELRSVATDATEKIPCKHVDDTNLDGNSGVGCAILPRSEMNFWGYDCLTTQAALTCKRAYGVSADLARLLGTVSGGYIFLLGGYVFLL
jgi:hypothetical protein